MKNLLLLLSAPALLSSCCHAERDVCVSKNAITLFFNENTVEEMDSLYVTGYDLSTGDVVIAEHLEDNTGRQDPYWKAGNMAYVVRPSYKWRIHIPATNRDWMISDYGIHRYNCSNCRDKSTVEDVTSFVVNGTVYSGTYARLPK